MGLGKKNDAIEKTNRGAVYVDKWSCNTKQTNKIEYF